MGNPDQLTQPSIGDLTLADIWILIKYFFVVEFAMFIVYGIPYILLTGFEIGVESSFGGQGKDWFNILLWGIVVFFIVMNLFEFLEGLSKMFKTLGNAVKNASFFKRLSIFLSLCLYSYLWRKQPEFAAIFSCFMMVPLGFLYDKYKSLLNKKKSLLGEENQEYA